MNLIRKIHIYSAVLVTGSLLMYIITGFLMTRHHMWKPVAEKSTVTEYPLSLEDGIKDEQIAALIQSRFNISGQRGKPQVNGKNEITIPFVKPGLRQKAVISADRKTIKITRVEMNPRSLITAFHRVKGYGGGFLYDCYAIMTDVTGAGILIFSITGLIIAFSNRNYMILKILIFMAGIGYTVLVILSFMNG